MKSSHSLQRMYRTTRDTLSFGITKRACTRCTCSEWYDHSTMATWRNGHILGYGKLMERLITLLQTHQRSILSSHLFIPQADEKQHRNISFELEPPVVVLGNASYSMDVAIRTATIISSGNSLLFLFLLLSCCSLQFSISNALSVTLLYDNFFSRLSCWRQFWQMASWSFSIPNDVLILCWFQRLVKKSSLSPLKCAVLSMDISLFLPFVALNLRKSCLVVIIQRMDWQPRQGKCSLAILSTTKNSPIFHYCSDRRNWKC